MRSPGRRIALVGWCGGVGTALISLLVRHPIGRRIAETLDVLFLLDREEGPPPDLRTARVLPATAVEDPDDFARLLSQHAIDGVIEVADVDTLSISTACARQDVDYVSASMQQRTGTAADGLTMIAARRLVPDQRPVVDGASHLIGSGMNPGVVNALVLAGLDELARRAGTAPTVAALEVYAIHVTEEDTTAPADHVRDDVFAMSWSPQHALDEILEPEAMCMARGGLARLGHRSHDRTYLARCGDREVEAMIVPHEEVVTIGTRFPSVESAFFYAIPQAARAALRRAPDRPPAAWATRKLYPPHEDRLVGRDRVGVVIASRRYGELWVGFDTPVTDGLRYGTNATLLQTAAGVLAGWASLGSRTGIHVVDELDWRAYLAIVEDILGPRQVHYSRETTVRPIAARTAHASHT